MEKNESSVICKVIPRAMALVGSREAAQTESAGGRMVTK